MKIKTILKTIFFKLLTFFLISESSVKTKSKMEIIINSERINNMWYNMYNSKD